MLTARVFEGALQELDVEEVLAVVPGVAVVVEGLKTIDLEQPPGVSFRARPRRFVELREEGVLGLMAEAETH